jgi:hypothetical protein
MKTSLFCTILSVSLFSLLECKGQTYSLQWRTNSLYVAFSDQDLTSTAKAAIVSDLQNCFRGWATNAEIRLVSNGETTNYVYYGTRTPCYPENIDFPDDIVNTSSGLALQIPKTLSDAYTNAFSFAAANSNIVAAAYEFVAFVSSSNFVAISSNALPDYVMQKNTTTNEIMADAQSIISELRHQTYYMPSVLGFKNLEIGPSATNLWMLVPCSSPLLYSDIKEWSGYPAIWHAGKWKFCSWE